MTRTFPEGFLFGTATAATQVEGHCTSSDWWAFAHEPGRVKGGDTPDIACDSWHRFEQDVAVQKLLGLNAHRMSVEWARLEPEAGRFDTGAFDRYREMLGSLRDAGIEPMVTLLHFTLPRWVAQRGGLLSPEFPLYFGRFVERTVDTLGDLNTLWVTINEPNVVVAQGYVLGVFPPARKAPRQAAIAHQALLAAHVMAYRAVHERSARRGHLARVGVAHHLRILEPRRRDAWSDRLGSRLVGALFNDAFARALCEGEARGVMGRLADGLMGVRAADAKGTQDFFGLNYYGRDLIRVTPRARDELYLRREVPADAEVSDLGWEVYPEGLGQLLRTWGHGAGIPVYVTENGIADARDAQRPSFLVRHLAQVADAIRGGVDVRGYYHWSLLDNFEWAEGYEPRFGLVAMDYETLARKPRMSAELYGRIARQRAIDEATWREHRSVPSSAWKAGRTR